jgi:methyltransferase
MAMWMWILIFFIICQRLFEMKIAKRNERWMLARGGIRVGEAHYKWFLMLHTLFFISIMLEAGLYREETFSLNMILLAVFISAQLARIWCIASLGRFWNTKIIVLPRVALIRKGPYKYVKHPNYIIVAIELFIIPLLFGAYLTAILFPLLHLLLLKIRIPLEERALSVTVKS